jgi:hypothetical protein
MLQNLVQDLYEAILCVACYLFMCMSETNMEIYMYFFITYCTMHFSHGCLQSTENLNLAVARSILHQQKFLRIFF